MLIRSQDKAQLIPMEQFAFATTPDGSVVANRNLFGKPSEIRASVIAKYSSGEKAIKVLDMICDAYEGNKYEETCHEGAYDYVPVFQMPEDDEMTI